MIIDNEDNGRWCRSRGGGGDDDDDDVEVLAQERRNVIAMHRRHLGTMMDTAGREDDAVTPNGKDSRTR